MENPIQKAIREGHLIGYQLRDMKASRLERRWQKMRLALIAAMILIPTALLILVF